MPEKKTLERAAEDKAEGKSPSTQAGEFVREEIEHIREGKHGARFFRTHVAGVSTRQEFLEVVERYFPGYPSDIRRRLSA